MKFFNCVTCGICFLVCMLPFASLQASPVKWEIYQAFPNWVEGESWLVFVKLTNVGNETIPLAGIPGSPMMEQIRFVPKWKQGKEPHTHGHKHHSHDLPEANQPWKSVLDWRESIVPDFDTFTSLALKPNQSEVIGDLGLRSLWSESGMPNSHMESFQLALRIGPNRYALSEHQTLVLADVPELESHPVSEWVERVGNFKVDIRQIEIAGERWIFYGSTRVARIPEGAAPRFHTEDDKNTLVIEFEGVQEDQVRVDVRQAFPLSGSERTVPHLHLWRSLTDRSMLDLAGAKGGFFEQTGLTVEQAQKLKWDGTDPELGGSPRQVEPPRDGMAEPEPVTKDGDAKSQASTGSDAHGVGFWLMIVALVGVGVVAFVLIRRRRGTGSCG